MDACPHEWDYFVIAFERDRVEGDMVDDSLSVTFRKGADSWERSGWLMPYPCFLEFDALHDAMWASESQRWRSCLLEIDDVGKYRFTFSDDPPLRLSYVFNDESQLRNYTPRPLE